MHEAKVVSNLDQLRFIQVAMLYLKTFGSLLKTAGTVEYGQSPEQVTREYGPSCTTYVLLYACQVYGGLLQVSY